MAHRPAVDEEAFNQSPPFADVNLFTSDQALAEAVELGGASSAQAGLEAFGALAGSEALLAECARDQRAARSLVEQLALAEAGALLLRHAPEAVSDGFIATRLGGT